MESMVLHENKINISHDRSGVRITVGTPLTPSEIKEMHAIVADVGHYVYVPSEITKEAYAYSFYIRKRQTVKDYLIQNECTISDFVSLVKSVNEILNLAMSLNVNCYDFIFDYSCIYTGQTLETAEFVYAPGANVDKGQNSISEMLLIASLHVQCDDNVEEANALKEATSIILEWEKEESTHFPIDEILSILNIEERKEKIFFTTWKPFLYFQFIMFLVFIFFITLIPFKENGVFIWIAFVLLAVSIDYLLIPGKKLEGFRFILEKRNAFKGMGLLKGNMYYVNRDNIKIGRDKNWADIEIVNGFVSRKHAVLYYQEDTMYLKDLSSKNGTYLNGERVEANKEVVVKKGSTIMFGHENIKIKYLPF